MKELSKESEGSKRTDHSSALIKRRENIIELECQKKILRKEETMLANALHERLCSEAQLENLN